MSDLVSGFTVAIMHIPQGMAYGMLAGVDPVIGIYTAFFPILLYVLMGNMPHVSMGTFAVVSILVSKPVMVLSDDYDDGEDPYYTPLEVFCEIFYFPTIITYNVLYTDRTVFPHIPFRLVSTLPSFLPFAMFSLTWLFFVLRSCAVSPHRYTRT